MNIVQKWFESPGAIALGWMLVHSLWEGAAVALILAMALIALRTSRARYLAACLAMLLLAAGIGITFARQLPQQRIHAPLAADRAIAPAVSLSNFSWTRSQRRDFQHYLPWIASFWLLGIVFFQLRGAVSWAAARRIRRVGVSAAPDIWQRRLEYLKARLRMTQSVELLESCLADVPVVIGYFRPVILVPAGLLTGLSGEQLETILVHELAHIRRHDYLVNLGQILAEGLLFYHPAVWWISSVIRTERENCCDDLAVEISGNAHEYARTLARLEVNRSEMVLAVSGGSLVKRVRRLLGQPERARMNATPLISALVLAVTLVAGLAAWQQPADKTKTPYEKWVKEDVVYIIQNGERLAFQNLHTDEERAHFIEQFWERRNPVPGSTVNEYKDEHYRRIGYVNVHYSSSNLAGWKTDRGRIYIQYGPPDEIESHPSPDAGAAPYEEWMYHLIQGVGRNVIIRYEDPSRNGEYRMTRDPHEP
jgi:GWxTD domain-containing protein